MPEFGTSAPPIEVVRAALPILARAAHHRQASETGSRSTRPVDISTAGRSRIGVGRFTAAA
ncbi:MAG: hypothetical protein ACJ786_42500 [Catenulispora sp.]